MTSPDLAVIDLRRARADRRDDARDAVLGAAARLLREDGPAALTVRAVAVAVNASTKVIYTIFGGKDGLLQALYLHSFVGLDQALVAQRDVMPAPARLSAMCRAYRGYALAHPALYNVMLGDLGRDFSVSADGKRQASATFRRMRDAVAECSGGGDVDADTITRLLWASMHGFVSLELHGLLGPALDMDGLFDRAVRGVLAARVIDLGPVGQDTAVA